MEPDYHASPPSDPVSQLIRDYVPLLQDRAAHALEAGGPIAAVLVLMSVIALTLVLLKIWHFRSLRLGQRQFAGRAVELHVAGDDEAALSLLARIKNPIARAMEAAIVGLRRPGADQSMVREDLIRICDDSVRGLRSGMRGLEVIATLSPLLGLLGTVLGMIDVFAEIAGADSRVSPALLSGGIWEALLTTAIGMGVAIPVIVAVNWLESRIERFAGDLESAVTRIFTADLNRFGKSESVSSAEFAQAAE